MGSSQRKNVHLAAQPSLKIPLPRRRRKADAEMSNSLDKNVHNVAVDGSFDDCQDFVKELFGDADIRRTHQLAAVNSINFARILAQMYAKL